MKKVSHIRPEALRPVVRVGVDLAKSVYAVVSVDRRDGLLFRPGLRRSQFEHCLRCLSAGCVVAMEACGGAHAWARFCAELGLQPRSLALQAVKPYIGGQKDDLRDARGSCEAAGRLSSRRQAKHERGIRQRRFLEHAIRDQLDLDAHLHRVHCNPVKHAWVRRVADWPHSSFHRFVRLRRYPLAWAAPAELRDWELEGASTYLGRRVTAEYPLTRPTGLRKITN